MKKLNRIIRKVIVTCSTRHGRSRTYQRRILKRQGFTLTELMVASLLLSIVISVAWTGLISMMNMSQAAQAKSARQIELNTALDVMTTEVRQAKAINRSGAIAANGSTISVQDVAESAGVNLNDLGPYGDIALYLELPTTLRDATCPTANGPVVADTVDKVVYDVRPSPTGWMSPNAVVRYGRIPNLDGSINPCSAPVANDIMADSLSDVAEDPSCKGILTGSPGFHTCTQGDNVELLFKSTIQDLDTKQASRHVTLRQASFSPPPDPTEEMPTLNLSLSFKKPDEKPKEREEVYLTWNWSGTEVDGRYQELGTYKLKSSEPWPYKVNIQDGDKTLKAPVGDPKSPGGINMTYELRKTPGNACFMVEGVTPEQETIESNQVCIVNGEIQGG